MNNKNDFTTGSIPKKLIQFMLPILGALILQAMYGAVDLLIVGWFGTTAGLSAVSTGSNIINLVVFTVAGLSVGITVLLGKYIGEKKPERCSKVIGSAICFFGVLSFILTIVLPIVAKNFAKLMQAPEEALELTALYVQICGGGIIFIIAYNLLSGIFRGIGNSKLPLLFVAIACVVNILGDLLFVAVFHWDVAGAALATVLAQAVSVMLSIIIIRKQELPFTLKKQDIGWNIEIKNFLKIGSPIALQEILTNVSFLALCAFINRLGLEASSGYGIANKIVAFIMLIPASLMQSMSAFIAQNVGSGNEKRAKQSMFTGMAIGASIGIVVAIFAFFRGDILASIFSDEAPVIQKTAEYLKGFSPEAIITCILFSFMGYFSGHGQTVFVMLQGLAQSFLVRLPFSYIMSSQPDASLTMIGLAAPVATAFGILLNFTYFIICNKRLEKQEK